MRSLTKSLLAILLSLLPALPVAAQTIQAPAQLQNNGRTAPLFSKIYFDYVSTPSGVGTPESIALDKVSYSAGRSLLTASWSVNQYAISHPDLGSMLASAVPRIIEVYANQGADINCVKPAVGPNANFQQVFVGSSFDLTRIYRYGYVLPVVPSSQLSLPPPSWAPALCPGLAGQQVIGIANPMNYSDTPASTIPVPLAAGLVVRISNLYPEFALTLVESAQSQSQGPFSKATLHVNPTLTSTMTADQVDREFCKAFLFWQGVGPNSIKGAPSCRNTYNPASHFTAQDYVDLKTVQQLKWNASPGTGTLPIGLAPFSFEPGLPIPN